MCKNKLVGINELKYFSMLFGLWEIIIYSHTMLFVFFFSLEIMLLSSNFVGALVFQRSYYY